MAWKAAANSAGRKERFPNLSGLFNDGDKHAQHQLRLWNSA
jgi:hypothetical protein